MGSFWYREIQMGSINWASINWFLVANTLLTFGAGVWFIARGQMAYGLLQMTFTISNIIFLWMGTK